MWLKIKGQRSEVGGRGLLRRPHRGHGGALALMWRSRKAIDRAAPDHAFASEARRTANEIGNPIKNMCTKSPVTNTRSGKDTLRG
jgi:hypothetical protein